MKYIRQRLENGGRASDMNGSFSVSPSTQTLIVTVSGSLCCCANSTSIVTFSPDRRACDAPNKYT